MALGDDVRAARPLVGRPRRSRARPPRPDPAAAGHPAARPAAGRGRRPASRRPVAERPPRALRRLPGGHVARHRRRGPPLDRCTRRAERDRLAGPSALDPRLTARPVGPARAGARPGAVTPRRPRACDVDARSAGRGVGLGRPLPAPPHRVGHRRWPTPRRRVGVRTDAAAHRGHHLGRGRDRPVATRRRTRSGIRPRGVRRARPTRAGAARRDRTLPTAAPSSGAPRPRSSR